jgi:peptidoglycan/xylan/chitin deacetylase (PgdA/CDA1 family)
MDFEIFSKVFSIEVLVVTVGVIATIVAFDRISVSHRFQLMGKYVSCVKTDKKLIALTFDDGPSGDSTQALLDALYKNGARASFFLVGRQIEKYPDLAAAIVGRGHQVGNHSYSHQSMTYGLPSKYRAEIEKTDALIRAAGYHREISFRAPFGVKFLSLPYVLREYGKVDVLWDVNPRDYKESVSGDDIVSKVVGMAKPGSIVLLHDRPKTAGAIEKLVKKLQRQGFELVTVDELIAVSDSLNRSQWRFRSRMRGY